MRLCTELHYRAQAFLHALTFTRSQAREMLKTEGKAQGNFQHLPRDLANINTLNKSVLRS